MRLDIIRNYIDPKFVLDIGANIGQFQREFKQVFPEAHLMSFEANPNCEEQLRATSEELGNTYMITLLAKDNNNYTYYSRRDDPIGTGNSIYKELTDFYTDDNTITTERKGVTLDEIMQDGSTEIPDIDLIKIDTQGSELDIISGGINTCKKAKAILLEVSVIPYNDGSPLKDAVIDFMQNIGFFPIDIIDEIYPFGSHQQDILFGSVDVFKPISPKFTGNKQ